MSPLIGTINGKRVFSDKTVASIVNSVITFTDGSWCNVDTGEVVNNGSGSISIGNPGQPTEKTTIGPTQYNCGGLEVRGIRADLEVIVSDGPGAAVTMTGPEGQLKAIKVSERSGTIIIGGRGIAIGGSNISIGGGGSTPNDVKIIVQVPKGAAVDLSDVDGRITVGDTEGSLRLSVSGEANVRVGRIGTLRARLSGSSQMDIRQVTGDVSINVSGAGSINIAGGEVKELTVSLSGMGNVHFGGTAQDAYLSVSGMGNVNVDRVVNQLHRSMSGMGRITVGNW